VCVCVCVSVSVCVHVGVCVRVCVFVCACGCVCVEPCINEHVTQSSNCTHIVGSFPSPPSRLHGPPVWGSLVRPAEGARPPAPPPRLSLPVPLSHRAAALTARRAHCAQRVMNEQPFITINQRANPISCLLHGQFVFVKRVSKWVIAQPPTPTPPTLSRVVSWSYEAPRSEVGSRVKSPKGDGNDMTLLMNIWDVNCTFKFVCILFCFLRTSYFCSINKRECM